MPGICGFLNIRPQPDSAALAAQMLMRLRQPACAVAREHVDPAGLFALGHVSLGAVPTSSQPVLCSEGRLRAVMDGELYDMEKLCRDPRLQRHRMHIEDQPGALLALFAKDGIDAISKLDGSFAAAVVDAESQTLSIISDRFGTRPVYYTHTRHRFAFSSSIFSLLADPAVPREFDWQGLSQFFTFGHYFNDNSSLAAIKILPAGAVLTFDANQNRLSLRRYWAGSERIAKRQSNRQEAFDAVDDALVKSVRKQQSSGGAKIGLSLSGGLDARTILGTLDHRSQNVSTVCMGMQGSHDHRASLQLASIVGCKHHSHILDTAFLGAFGQHLEHMVRLTDGQYLSQCIVMPTLPLYQQLGIRILMRGHAGELLHMSKAYNYSLDAATLRLRDSADLELWLWKRLKAYIHDGLDGPLFAKRGFNEMEIARESLRQALSDTPYDDLPANRISHLFLDQRVRRETMLSMMKFRSVAEPRLPYLDRTLVEQLLAMPVEWRMGDELQTYILQKHQPRFCLVENTNTGAKLGAGKLRRTYSHFKSRVFSKLGMPGYQPYERLGLWLRRELAELVKDTLINDRCLERGVFHPDTVRAVVRRHLTGERNHTYLIMALMIFEVGHRWLLDDETFGVGHDSLHLSLHRADRAAWAVDIGLGRDGNASISRQTNHMSISAWPAGRRGGGPC